MMSMDSSQTQPRKAPAIQWLMRRNSEISQWAASLSWWRLFFLIVIMMIAGSMIGDMLRLKHESVRSGQAKKK